MCQQWFSVVGNLTEIVGFLLVVREWYHVFVLMRYTDAIGLKDITRGIAPRPKVENGLIPAVRNTECGASFGDC